MMLLSFIEQQLSARWGNFSCENNYRSNGMLPYMNNGLAFNYIFSPAPISSCVDRYNCELTSELLDLYSACNGMRLFLSGLCIFGVQTREYEMEPFDIATENYNIHARMAANNCENKDLIFFGSYGKDCVFAYDSKKTERILCVKNGQDVPIMTFDTLKELFDFFVPRIADQYDMACTKKVPNKKYKGIPVLANSMLSIEEIL